MNQSNESFTTPRPRFVNEGSLATADNWHWSDFSQFIESSAGYIALTANIDWVIDNPQLDQVPADKIRGDVFVFQQIIEARLTNQASSQFSRQRLFEDLAAPEGQDALTSTFHGMARCAALEARTGICCKPVLAFGLEEQAYPIILSTIQRRYSNESPGFMKRMVKLVRDLLELPFTESRCWLQRFARIIRGDKLR